MRLTTYEYAIVRAYTDTLPESDLAEWVATLRDVQALPAYDVMPEAIEARHHGLCESARKCYALRNDARSLGPNYAEQAAEYHDLGDVYYSRACAVLAEWVAS